MLVGTLYSALRSLQSSIQSNCAGFNVFSTHIIREGGHTLATILPLINPMGMGP